MHAYIYSSNHLSILPPFTHPSITYPYTSFILPKNRWLHRSIHAYVMYIHIFLHFSITTTTHHPIHPFTPQCINSFVNSIIHSSSFQPCISYVHYQYTYSSIQIKDGWIDVCKNTCNNANTSSIYPFTHVLIYSSIYSPYIQLFFFPSSIIPFAPLSIHPFVHPFI